MSPFQTSSLLGIDSLFSGSLRNSLISGRESILHMLVPKRLSLFSIALDLGLNFG